jgi:hypothetical protein
VVAVVDVTDPNKAGCVPVVAGCLEAPNKAGYCSAEVVVACGFLSPI